MTQYHPDADLFPIMGETELAELAADIAANGLRESIKLDHAGDFLIDGRNRERACERAGVDPRYDRLPIGTDIFAYVVSVNLRRRHLTDEQRRAIIREIAARNPDLSNRQIAKLADVDHKTVAAAIRSGGEGSPSERKSTGADGKSYPATGRISDEKRSAILADLKNPPEFQGEIARKHGVSQGWLSDFKKAMQKSGDLPAARKPPTLAEQLAKRAANLPRFDTMTREERGMGSREYGAEQHPDYPPGWTRDAVHREKYGRIQLYTPAQIAEQELVKRFHAVIVAVKAIAENGPDADDLESISYQEFETVEVQLEKFGQRVLDLISGYRARIRKCKQPNLTIVKP